MNLFFNFGVRGFLLKFDSIVNDLCVVKVCVYVSGADYLTK